jgi:hypothetical protein
MLEIGEPMNRITQYISLSIAGLLLAAANLCAKPLTTEQITEIRTKIEQRKYDFFARDAGKPLMRAEIEKNWNNRGDFTRHYNQSIVLFATRAFELNEQIDEANAALQELCYYHLNRPQTFLEIHSFPSSGDDLARIYIFYGPNGTKTPNLLTAETSAVLEKTMWEWANEKSKINDAEINRSQTWWITDSENHHAIHITTCWAFTGILKKLPYYKDKAFNDGHLPAEHYQQWTAYLKEYLRQRASKGTFVEIYSPSYATATLKSLYNAYDFSENPVLKNRANMLLALYWTLWAEEQIDAVTGGAQARVTPDAARRGGSFLRRAAWYTIGIGDPDFVHTTMLQFVTTTWQVPDIVLQIAYGWQTQAPYEIRQRRMGLAHTGYHRPPEYRLITDFGGILRYTWCTPDFIMGSLITEALPTEDWAAISSQNRWSGVIFAGDPDARVFPAPYNIAGRPILNGFWSVQSKGTMISQQLAPSNVGGALQSWRVFFSNAGLSKPINKGAWTFAEAKKAYVGVLVLEGDTVFEQQRFGHWLICDDEMTPIIIEVGSKSDYSCFDAFKEAAIAQKVGVENLVLNYRSLGGDDLIFYTDQSQLPKVNGVTIDLAPALVYDSPFVQSSWDSGVVTIQFDEEKYILNFNEE